MAQVDSIDSNVTSLRIAEEASPGTLPGTPDWYAYEPNNYANFGAETSTSPRTPINPDRQNKKGPVTDLNASAGFNHDFTQTGIEEIMQGFFFADFRRKGEEVVTAIDTDTSNPDEFEVASTTGFQTGSLIKGSGFADATNNGVFPVTAIVADTSVEVADGSLVADASPASGAKITVVGFQGAAGDIDVDATGTWPALTSTTADFTTMDLNVGETIYIGGDGAGTVFSNAANNGWKRIRSIAANRLEFDKSATAMVTEASTSETIQLFFGRVLKNELSGAIVERTYQLERQLGAPDNASPAQIQSEYLIGAAPNTLVFNFPLSDIVKIDMGFIAQDRETRTGATGVKSGNRPASLHGEAYNTTQDFRRIKMSIWSSGNEAPSSLYAFAEEMTINIDNGVTPKKALGRLGGFDVNLGNFSVSGSVTAYFGNVSALDAVRNNSDVSFDVIMAKSNAGFALDIPLISLSNGQLNVEPDQSVKLPLSITAAEASSINSSLTHTAMMVFFDYLPTVAMA